MADCRQHLRLLTGRPGHALWADDLSYLEVDPTRIIGRRQVTDAYLAGLARAHAGRLATFDAGLVAVHLDVADLVATR